VIVYAVEAGVDDDYRVVDIFATEDLAMLYVQAMPPRQDSNVIRMEVKTQVSQEIEQGFKTFNIAMAMNGTIIVCSQILPGLTSPLSYNKRLLCWDANISLPKNWEIVSHSVRKGPGIQGRIWATNKEEAIKKANHFREHYEIN